MCPNMIQSKSITCILNEYLDFNITATVLAKTVKDSKTVRQSLFYMEYNKTINTSTSAFCP